MHQSQPSSHSLRINSMGRRIDPSLSCFSYQPVLHDWCTKGHGMCYPVCGMMHIKEPLLLIGKSSPCGGSGFPLLLSEWSFTICPTPYNRKYNMLSASLNKTFPSFLPYKFDGAPRTLTWQSLDLVQCHLELARASVACQFLLETDQ